jgi:hypothetical protein
MRTVKNFTQGAIGSNAPGRGRIGVCPHCGRAGVVDSLPEGASEFVHIEMREVMGDGMLVQPIDRCPLRA